MKSTTKSHPFAARSRMTHILAATFAAISLAASTAVSQTAELTAKSLYEQALPLLKDPGNTKALDEGVVLLRKSAESGDAESQNRLGFLYENGIGVSKDPSQARDWFAKAAAGGFTKAEFNYGRYLVLGLGGDKKLDEGLEWIEKAAAQSVIPAQLALGKSYYFGEYGRKIDYAKALPYLQKAAEAGDAEAQNLVGAMFSYGQGVKLSKEQAAKWFLRAANQGHAKAQASIADLYLTGTGIKLDKVESIKFYMLSAKQGEVTGVNPLEALMPDIDPKIISEATKRADDFQPSMEAIEQAPVP